MKNLRILASTRSCKSATGTIALNLHSGRYYGFNQVGAVIWIALTESKSQSDIAELVHRQFGISGAQLEHDINSFFALLLEVGLVEE